MTRGIEVRFLVDHVDERRRLDVVLGRTLGIPRTRAAARIDAGDVRVDGRPGRRSQRLAAGAEVVVTRRPAPAAVVAPPVPPIRYRDEHLLVVAKPPGLVVHPGHGHVSGTLVDALRGAGIPLAPAGDPERPGIVHRLDRDTSGLMVVASTTQAHAGLVAGLGRRELVRRYLAMVRGVPAARRGRIEAPVGRDPDNRVRFATVADGKPATTRYIRLDRGAAPQGAGGDEVSLLACRLETGRTHQIRVHLAAIGHPIIGDLTYGGSAGLARVLGLRRPFLHAARLAFRHPVTDEAIDLHEPLPDDLVRALRMAGIAPPDLSEALHD